MRPSEAWEPAPTLAERMATAAAYEAHAEVLAERYQRVRPEGRIKDVEKAFESYEGDNPKVIELGCGPGREVDAILRHTDSYLGLDISPAMIKIAQAANPSGRFGVTDIVGYEFPTAGADIIFAFATLLHLDRDEVQKLFAKAERALSKGGIFYISLKHGEYHREVKENEYGKRVFYYYEPEDIQSLAGDGYEALGVDEHMFENTPWFTIILRKR